MRRWSLARSCGLALGVLADEVVPDPRRGHPVAVFGSLFATLERRMWADARSPGVAYALTGVSAATLCGLALDHVTCSRRDAAVVMTAACTWAVVGQASLVREATAMREALAAGDLPAARDRLPRLCGRDPSELDETGLARATVESVAENTADALVAPLLWGAALGPAGLLGYRAVNTLDAMVGHRGRRYGRFGWAAARLDDAANWLPARLTALLTVAAAPVVGGRPGQAWRVLRRDGARHPSPNAGRCEAAAAGALDLRLGGANRYPYGVEHRHELGEGPSPGPDDITRAIRLARAVGAGAVLAVILPTLAGTKAPARRKGPAHPRVPARVSFVRAVTTFVPETSVFLVTPRRKLDSVRESR